MSRLVHSGDMPAQQIPRKAGLAAAAFGLLTVLAGCNEVHDSRAAQPLSREMLALMQEKGVSPQAPMLIRAYKKEAEFEVWKMRPDGSYELLKTFPICRWSGQLGPKTHEGDRQSPEGFYSITPAMMNPNSAYYLSFNVGYPNAYDRAHGATGGAVMVHGVCSSAGCFSMTDAEIAEIYALARESFTGGQRAIQMQSYPFHMNVQNLAKYRLDPNMAFWKELKKGHDHFEARKADVAVAVCGGHYVFDAKSANGQPLDAQAACPPLKFDPEIETKAAERQRADDAAIAELVARGERPVRLVYQDGGQHPAFSHRISEVSRPDALTPPVELALDDPNARYNAKARSASTTAALVLARAQAQAQDQSQPRHLQAAAEPAAPSEKFAAALGAIGHDDAKSEMVRPESLAPLTTEGAKSADAAKDAVKAPASAAPNQAHLLSKAFEAKPAAKTLAQTSVARTSVNKASVIKTGAEKPQAAKPAKQKVAEAATLR
jgi:murein L,D-transpeptidase YafK